MNFQKFKEKLLYIIGIIGDFIVEHKRYFLAGCIFICMALVVFLGTGESAAGDKALQGGVYKSFKENKNNDLTKLISDYYKAYAEGNTDKIQKLVTNISDEEISYIKFYSQYIEKFSDMEVVTKEGLNEGDYFTSVKVNLKYENIDTAAPGLDFFYVQTDKDGKLFINGLYDSFNQENNIYEMDTNIADLYSIYIRQQDFLDLWAGVQSDFAEALESDATLKAFLDESLKEAHVQWNQEYKAQVEQAEQEAAKAEEEAKAKAEEEAKAAEEAAKAQQEEENAFKGKTDSKVNVRAAADKTSEKLGSVEKGTEITIYGEEGDFYKFDYNGTKAYIVKSSVKVSNGDDTEEQQAENENVTITKSYAKGDKITIKSTTNIRSKMDTSSSKVAVAYEGDTVEVVMSYAEGWTKVKYKNKEGFIRTDLL